MVVKDALQTIIEEKYFVTDKTLRAELQDLEAAATMPTHKNSPDLLVTDMNENKLAITIKSKNESVSPTASPPDSPLELSPETHDQKSGPRLHGILKQRSRTMSESSDEVFTYSRENSVCLAGSESPISESEEGGEGEPGMRRVRKKSVSFNEKVDQQTYKHNQPTTSLRNTLKNKRKNQRKAERKHLEKVDKVNRRNRNSDSISEMSSDGEGSSTHDEASNHEDTDNNGAGDEIDNAVDNEKNISRTGNNTTNVIADANGNITTPNTNNTTDNSDLNQQKNKKNARRKNRRNKNKQAAHKGDEVASDAHQPPETNSPSSQSEGEGKGGFVALRESCDNRNDSCDDNRDDNEKVVPKKKLVEIVKDDGHDSDDDGEGDSPDDGERTSEKNETILKLEEEGGTKAAAGERAQCPVSFTNSVMFDLD